MINTTRFLKQHSEKFVYAFIETRTICLEKQISNIANQLLPRSPKDPIQLEVNANIFQMPHVQKRQKEVTISVPATFLFETEDFPLDLVLWKPFLDRCFASPLSHQQLAYFSAFEEYIQDSELSRKARTFVLAHEISHIALNHLDCAAKTLEQSRSDELEADRLAAKTIPGALVGGIYLLDILNKFLPQKTDITHPSLSKRIAHLRRCL